MNDELGAHLSLGAYAGGREVFLHLEDVMLEDLLSVLLCSQCRASDCKAHGCCGGVLWQLIGASILLPTILIKLVLGM